jgi:hypothetical protein
MIILKIPKQGNQTKMYFFVKRTTALTYRNIKETPLLFKRLLSTPLELQRTLLKYKDLKTYKTDY